MTQKVPIGSLRTPEEIRRAFLALQATVDILDPLLLSNGTDAAPTYSFASDPDTGMYRPAANQLGFAAGGVELLRVGSADVDVMTGHLNLISNTGAQTMSIGEWSSGYDYAAVETPSMVLLMGNSSNVNSQGFLRTKGTGSFNLGCNNSNDLTIVNGGGITTSSDLTVGGDLIASVGSATAPSLTFTGDTDTGMYWYGTNDIGFTAGGTRRFSIASVGVYAYIPFFTGNGNAAAPSHSFYNDTNTGMYLISSDKLAFSAGNDTVLTIVSGDKVGIGTTSPSTPLNIVSSGSDQLRLQNTTSTTQGPYISLWHSTARIGYIGFPNNDDLHLKNESAGGQIYLSTNNTTRLTIASGGAISTVGNLTVGGILYTTDIDGTGGAVVTANSNNRQGFYSGYNLLPYTGGNNYFRATDHRFQGEGGGGTYWMLVGSTQTTVYGSLKVSNETTLTGNSTGELRVTSDYGYADFGPKNASACHIYTDRPGFYMDKYLNMNGGSTVRGALVLSSGNLTTSNGNIQVFGRHYIDLNVATASWSGCQLLVQSANTSTSSNTFVGMTFHNRRYGIAPIIRNYGPYGETVDFTNNPGTAFIYIRAAAFVVNSTIRVKDDIKAVEDADAIKMAEDFLLVSYTPKVRPQTMRPNERFNRIDAKWQESGRPPLIPQSAYTDSHDHDCSIDNCDGSLGNECPVTVNDTRIYSGLAEWTGETNPEIAFFDEGGIAEGLDVAQIASSALGAVGALSRKLTLAMETIDSLQDRLAVLEAGQ